MLLGCGGLLWKAYALRRLHFRRLRCIVIAPPVLPIPDYFSRLHAAGEILKLETRRGRRSTEALEMAGGPCCLSLNSVLSAVVAPKGTPPAPITHRSRWP